MRYTLDVPTVKWAMACKRWSVADIAVFNEQAGYFFFSRDTMRFFGDTRANFTVHHKDGKVYLVRKRRGSRDPRKGPVCEIRLFDRATGAIGLPFNYYE